MKWSRLAETTTKRRRLGNGGSKGYRFGQFLVDCRSACLRRDGVALPLRPKSFDVLVYLVQHPAGLFPRRN